MSRIPAAAALPAVVGAKIAALFLMIRAAVCAGVLPDTEPLNVTPINEVAAVAAPVMATDCLGNWCHVRTTEVPSEPSSTFSNPCAAAAASIVVLPAAVFHIATVF